jgi:hypothetical protein
MKFRVKHVLQWVALASTATLLLKPEWSKFGYAAGSPQSSNVSTQPRSRATQRGRRGEGIG